MAAQISDFPQNSQERQIFDAAYSQDDGWLRVAAFFLAPLPLAPFWGPITGWAGLEGGAVLVFAVQVAAIATIPDRVQMFRAKRALALFRAEAAKGESRE